MPAEEVAVILMNPCVPVGVLDASDPPASIASQRPQRIALNALPMLWVLAAQAVAVVSQGPVNP